MVLCVFSGCPIKWPHKLNMYKIFSWAFNFCPWEFGFNRSVTPSGGHIYIYSSSNPYSVYQSHQRADTYVWTSKHTSLDSYTNCKSKHTSLNNHTHFFTIGHLDTQVWIYLDTQVWTSRHTNLDIHSHKFWTSSHTRQSLNLFTFGQPDTQVWAYRHTSVDIHSQQFAYLDTHVRTVEQIV